MLLFKKVQVYISYYRDIIGLIIRSSPTLCFLNFGVSIIQSVFPALSLLVLKKIIDAYTSSLVISFATIIQLIIVLGIVQIASSLFTQLSVYITAHQNNKIVDYISAILMSKSSSIDQLHFDNPNYNNTFYLIQQSIGKTTLLTSIINSIIINALSFCLLFFTFLSFNSFYAATYLICIIPLSIIKITLTNRILHIENSLIPIERDAYFLFQISTSSNYSKEVRSFNFAKQLINLFKTIKKYVFEKREQANKKLFVSMLVIESFEAIIITSILLFLAHQAWLKAITLSIFIVVVPGIQRLQGSLKSLMLALLQLIHQKIFIKEFKNYMNIPESYNINEVALFPNTLEELAFKNVSFAYPQKDNYTLQEITLRFKPGSITAIVGENGSGKSTITKLIAKLYCPDNGNISINGIDIQKINKESYHKNVSVLFQDYEKYPFALKENITLHKEDFYKNNFDNCIHDVGLEQLIKKFPNGIETQINNPFEKNNQLSGGEWQKIALARVLYTDARIIVLDEPCNSLDSRSEYLFLKNLKKIADDKIIILITHQLSNLHFADHIYVLKDGKIIEGNSYDTLLDNKGVFYEMFNQYQYV